MDDQPSTSSAGKSPVVRGARACTVCRAAKMRCVGADDGQPCHRCRKGNTECIFEKHRRGRKPGSKLSEASKMLRRLEKGINTAKAKSQLQTNTDPMPFPVSASRTQADGDFGAPGPSNSPGATYHQFNGQPHHPNHPNHNPPNHPISPYAANGSMTTPSPAGFDSSEYNNGPRNMYPAPSPHQKSQSAKGEEDDEMMLGNNSNTRGTSEDDDDDDDDDKDQSDYNLFPASLLAQENKRHSFFRTILNPSADGSKENASSGGNKSAGSPSVPMQRRRSTAHTNGNSNEHSTDGPNRSGSIDDGSSLVGPTPSSHGGLEDPISAGLIDEGEAKVLFDLVFLRLNPFICLFDPVLHTVGYVRSRCPFLFSCLIMAGCKFWKPELYQACQRLAADFAVKAFSEGWKRVEVVQGFACMTYWKEPDDTKTWTYIGYAARMAVELGLNRYVAKPPENESEQARRERRNRERTYLVLFVHDRSLSMQTGRQWMLPEDDLVRNSVTWHQDYFVQSEDVIVAAFVQLRRIAAETTDVFYLHKGVPGVLYADVNYEILLRGCNSKLTQWMDFWQGELKKVGSQDFHRSMLSFFRLHVRLFLNSFGLQSSMQAATRETPSLQALSNCYTSALQTLEIVTTEFAPVGMLRYVQESITVMTAYSAVFLLRLLRHTSTLSELNDGATQKIYDLISQTADVYQEAAMMASSSSSAAYHARFLRSLVAKDMSARARTAEKANKLRDAEGMSVSGSSAPGSSPSFVHTPSNGVPSYHPPTTTTIHPSPHVPTTAMASPGSYTNSPVAHHNSHASSSTGQSSVNGDHQSLQSFQNALSAPIQQDQSFRFPASPRLPAHPTELSALNGHNNMYSSVPMQNDMSMGSADGQSGMYPQNMYASNGPTTEADAHYWRNMFLELGFGGVEPTIASDLGFGDLQPTGLMDPNSMGLR